MKYTTAEEFPKDVKERFEALFKTLTQDQKRAIVKMDPDTFCPYIEFEGYNLQIVLAEGQ